MQVFRGIDNIGTIRKAVVSTGSFDGVHVGHRVILKRLNELAKQTGGDSVLVTFHPHPRKVLYPDTAGKDLKLINTQREKVTLLEETGLDHLVIIPFTREFSETSSIDFIRKVLVERIHAARIVIGFNHHFGHRREGDFEYLFELGRYYNFQVEEIPEQDIENEAVSSTRIRKALKEGHIQRANAYLDHLYLIMGAFGEGSRVFGDAGIRSMNIRIEEKEKLLPPPGLYAADASIGPDKLKCLAAIIPEDTNAGTAVDIHMVEEDVDWSGLDGKVRFHKTLWLGNLREQNNLAKQLRSGMEKTKELIY